jgi:hypothetical protein
MPGLAEAFGQAFRNWVTDGVPASGANKPSKAEIRALGGLIDTLLSVSESGFLSYETIAARNADTGRADGAIAYVYRNNGNANDAENGFAQWNDGAAEWETTPWLTDPGAFQNPFLQALVINAGSTSSVRPGLEVTETWTNDLIHKLLRLVATDTGGANPASTLAEFLLGALVIYEFRKDSNFLIRKTALSKGGIKVTGGSGEMALTSGEDGDIGGPAEVFHWYWQGGLNGSGYASKDASILRGMGSNRTSFESGAVLVHISDTGRFEWEGYTAPRLAMVGFEAGSAIGKPFDFNNYGQTPTYANPLVSFSVALSSHKAASFGLLGSGIWTENAYIDGAGNADFNGRVNAARLRTDSYTVATLPSSPGASDRAYVTDATAPAWGATVVGGGSIKCPVTHDGTNWKVG